MKNFLHYLKEVFLPLSLVISILYFIVSIFLVLLGFATFSRVFITFPIVLGSFFLLFVGAYFNSDL